MQGLALCNTKPQIRSIAKCINLDGPCFKCR